MEAIFKTKIEDINIEFIENLKSLFSKNAIVEIRVKEIGGVTENFIATEVIENPVKEKIKTLEENNLLKKTIAESR